MNVPDDERNVDELWDEAQADATTVAVDDELEDEVDAQADETPLDEPTTPPTFDPEAFKASLYQDFEQNVLPRHRDQWLHEAQNRARQSQEAREQRINERLKPVFNLLKSQQAEGWLTPEAAQQQLQQAHRDITQQEEQQAKQQTEWENRQAWLRQQNTQQQVAQPAWVESWKQQMNNVLATSGLDDADPEVKMLTLNLTDPDPQRALALLKESVATAVTAKEKRMQTERPRKERPFVDMGVGSSGGGGNPIAGIEDTGDLWRLATGG